MSSSTVMFLRTGLIAFRPPGGRRRWAAGQDVEHLAVERELVTGVAVHRLASWISFRMLRR